MACLRMDSFTCIDWYMLLLTVTRKCTAVLKNSVAFCFLIMIDNSVLDRQWHGSPLLEMNLNRRALFLDDEKINYFLMLCSAKHFINLGSSAGVSPFFGWGGGGVVYSICYSKCSLGLPALASSGILLEMQSLRPHLQFREAESHFNSIPRSCSCTLKFAKCCSKSGISKIGSWSKSGQRLVFIKFFFF